MVRSVFSSVLESSLYEKYFKIQHTGTIVIGSWNRKIHAIDSSTGLSKWELDVEDMVEATAAIDREDNVYVGVWGGHVLGIRGHDGEIMWKQSFGSSSISSGITLLRDGTIAFGSDDGRVRFLSERNFVPSSKASSMAPPDSSTTNSNKECSTTQQHKVWSEFRGGHRNAYSGQTNLEGPERLHIMWTIRRGMSFSASPVFDENERRMFVGNADGYLYVGFDTLIPNYTHSSHSHPNTGTHSRSIRTKLWKCGK